MPRNICSVCDNDSFENISGYYYCTVCNTKAQNLRDLELSEDEVDHKGQQELTKSKASKTKKLKTNEDDRNIENSYSTFHVYNCLLKRQCDDLVALGVNPIIHKVVKTLWAKYLQKLGVAYLKNGNDKINSDNIKWERDKKYFETFKLNMEYENESKPSQISESIEANKEEHLNKAFEDEEDKVDKEKSDSTDEEQTEEENEDSHIVDSDESDSFRVSKKRILLIKFEWIRMPHTVSLIHLALLIMKSHVLITDLVRFIYDGKLSYFNINEVLPNWMEFAYGDDSSMFNVISLPQADYLRYLTAKLGQFLELKKVEILPVNEIASRFILDLNLPSEMHEFVKILIERVEPIKEFDFEHAKYKNLEQQALSYIYAVILILFIYNKDLNLGLLDEMKDSILAQDDFKEREYYLFDEWMNVMEDRLIRIRLDIFGCDLNEIETIDDLKTLKLSSYNHRHKTNTKPYISQYRKAEILDTLKKPLEDVNEYENDVDMKETKEHEHPLLYITKLDKSKYKDFRNKSLDIYLNEENINLFTQPAYKSSKLKAYFKDHFQTSETRGKYLLGLETRTNDKLLDMFHELSQTNSFFKFYKSVKKLLNKFINSK